MKSLFFNNPNFSFSPVKSDSQRLRIADILVVEEDEDYLDFGMDRWRRSDGSTILQCSSPWWIVARWLAALRRVKETRNIVVLSHMTVAEEERDVRRFTSRSMHAKRLMNGLDMCDSSPSATESEESDKMLLSTWELGVVCSISLQQVKMKLLRWWSFESKWKHFFLMSKKN